MQVTITAVGPDHRGLADPIVHYVATAGANIHEIQMYDRDSERLFAMMLRIEWPADEEPVAVLRERLNQIGELKGLTIRTWSRDEHARARLAICTTYRPEPALALLRDIRDKRLKAEAAVIIGNRSSCRGVAEQFGVDFHDIGDARGEPDNVRLVSLLDEYEIDYVILARYMRILPLAPAGSSPAGESSICITGCCRRFRVFGRITTPTRITCSPTERPSTSSCRNWMRGTRSSTRARLPSFLEHLWMR